LVVVVLVLVIGHQQFSCICGVVVVVVKTKVKSKEVRKRVQHQFYFLVSSSNKPAEEATTGAQRQTSPFGPRGSTRITDHLRLRRLSTCFNCTMAQPGLPCDGTTFDLPEGAQIVPKEVHLPVHLTMKEYT
jgi:hypothetical protein